MKGTVDEGHNQDFAERGLKMKITTSYWWLIISGGLICNDVITDFLEFDYITSSSICKTKKS